MGSSNKIPVPKLSLSLSPDAPGTGDDAGPILMYREFRIEDVAS